MPTIKRILGDDKSKQGDEAVGYVEGNFIRCYEHSAYLLAQKHGLKPSKRAFKNVGVQVVSVGFPFTSREKYLPNAVTVDEGVWRGRVEVTPAVGFDEWKDSLPLPAEQRDGAPSVPTVEKLSAVSGLPVYRACYNLTLYVMQWSINVPRDTRNRRDRNFYTSESPGESPGRQEFLYTIYSLDCLRRGFRATQTIGSFL